MAGSSTRGGGDPGSDAAMESGDEGLFEEAEEAAEAELGDAHPKNKKKAMPSLEELEAMADEDDDAQENSDAAAEEILNSILEDEESGELNA